MAVLGTSSGEAVFELKGVLAGQGELAALIAAKDWSKTPIGAMSSWPQSLRTTVSVMLNTRFPMFLFWGPDAICLYNDAYRPSLGSRKHPSALGQRGSECWADIWHIIWPQIDAAMTLGDQTWFEDQLVPFERSGYFEEIYFTYSYSPVHDECGEVGGTLVVCSETTERVVAERVLRMLHRLSSFAGDDVEPALTRIRSVLADGGLDVPIALLYEIDHVERHATLSWSVGIEAGLRASPRTIAFADPTPAWPVASVVASGEVEAVDDVFARFPGLAGGPWLEKVREAMVLPVTLTGFDGPSFVLVAVASPRRTLDHAYRAFFALLATHIATVLSYADRRADFAASEARLGWARQGEAEAMRRAAREHAIAVELQHAMLGRVDPIDSLDVAVAYQAADIEHEVGGDWYDVIELAERRVAFVVGDVAGHNIAAAAAMGQLRSATRALATVCDGPGELTELADAFAVSIHGTAMSTMACAMLALDTGALIYQCAGHPPPLVLRRDGSADYLWDGRGLPLGIGPALARVEGVSTLEDGETLILFSDGLIERRDEPLDAGLERLRETTRAAGGLPAELVCHELIRAMFKDARQRDDVAVLVARRSSPEPPNGASEAARAQSK